MPLLSALSVNTSKRGLDSLSEVMKASVYFSGLFDLPLFGEPRLGDPLITVYNLCI